MRQVNEDELIHIIMDQLRQMRPTLLKDFHHHDPKTALLSRYRAAWRIAQGMNRLEIMSDAPEPPPFRYAALDGVSGIGGFSDPDASVLALPLPG